MIWRVHSASFNDSTITCSIMRTTVHLVLQPCIKTFLNFYNFANILWGILCITEMDLILKHATFSNCCNSSIEPGTGCYWIEKPDKLWQKLDRHILSAWKNLILWGFQCQFATQKCKYRTSQFWIQAIFLELSEIFHILDHDNQRIRQDFIRCNCQIDATKTETFTKVYLDLL